MSLLLLKRPYKTKPKKVIRPNQAHPQLLGCVCWLPLIRNSFHDAVRSNHGRRGFFENGKWVGDDFECDDFFSWIVIDDHPSLRVTGGDYAVSCHYYVRTQGGYEALFEKALDIDSSREFGFYFNSPTEGWWASGLENGKGWTSDGFTTGEWHHLIMQVRGSTMECYLDGEFKFSDTASNKGTGSGNIHIGTDHPIGGIDWIDGFIRDFRVYNRWLEESVIRDIHRNPWAPFERRIWVPVETGPPGPVQLQIDDLRHGRSVDQVNVEEIVIAPIVLSIDSLIHTRPVDNPLLGVDAQLIISGLAHARTVDDLSLISTFELTINELLHFRRVDPVDVQPLIGVVLDVTDNRHGRPVDSLLFGVEQPIIVDSLRHGRPMDSVDVQPLLGDQTGMGATSSEWTLNAGQALNNASLIDFDYHVLEGVFDSNQSVLGVDGTRVTGPAGMRDLTALTVGADVDGQRRMQGEIAEVRIYAGALSQADRDRIAQELTIKWITG